MNRMRYTPNIQDNLSFSRLTFRILSSSQVYEDTWKNIFSNSMQVTCISRNFSFCIEKHTSKFDIGHLHIKKVIFFFFLGREIWIKKIKLLVYNVKSIIVFIHRFVYLLKVCLSINIFRKSRDLKSCKEKTIRKQTSISWWFLPRDFRLFFN